MTTFKKSLICLSLFASLTSVANAQLVSTKGGSRDQTFGLSSTNVQFYEGGEIRRTDLRYRATPSSTPQGPVRMRYDANGFILVHTHVFGFKFTAFSARADCRLIEGRGNNSSSYYISGTPYSSSVRGHIRLKIGSYVFYERTRYASGHIGGRTYSRNVIDASNTFYAAGIPITVGVRGGATMGLGAGANLQLNPAASQLWSSRSTIGLDGYGTGYCSGSASAAVGWSGFGAGVEFELRFLNGQLTMGAAGSSSDISGRVQIAVQPLRIFLNAFAEAGARYTVNIYNWALGYSFTWRKTFS